MKRVLAILSALCSACFIVPCLGQPRPAILKGLVCMGDGRSLGAVRLTIVRTEGGMPLAMAESAIDGTFSVALPSGDSSARLLIAEHPEMLPDTLPLPPDFNGIARMVLWPKVVELPSVLIRAPAKGFETNGDTLTLRAAAYRMPDTRRLQDLLEHMPGFEVGPDGRIRFEGKEVDRILIDGHDLTERDYRLLSRGVDARLVEKVQVLRRFDPDRLLRSVRNPDRIALNLTIEEAYRHRWTGNLEAGGSLGPRRMAASELVRFDDAGKFMVFLEHDKTGKASAPDRGPATEEGEEGEMHVDWDRFSVIAQDAASLPDGVQPYVRDNRDLSAWATSSSDPAKGLRIRLMTGIWSSILLRQGGELQRYFPPGLPSWWMRTDFMRDRKEREGVASIALLLDRGGTVTGRIHVSAAARQHQEGLLQSVDGAIVDTLKESLGGRAGRLDILAVKTRLLRPGLVLHSLARVSGTRYAEDLSSGSQGWVGFHKVSAVADGVEEQILSGHAKASVRLQLMGAHSHVRWQAGISGDAAGVRRRASLSAVERTNGHAYPENILGSRSDAMQLRLTALVEQQRERGPSPSLGLEFGTGAHHAHFGTGYGASGIVYQLSAALRHRPAPFRSASLALSTARGMPDPLAVHPDSIAGASVTVLRPPGQPGFVAAHSAVLGYFSLRPDKGTQFRLQAAFSGARGGVVQDRHYAPGRTGLSNTPSPGRVRAHLQASGDAYLNSLRTKLSLSLSGTATQTGMSANGIRIRHTALQGQLRAGAVSVWKGPLNAEAFLSMEPASVRIRSEGRPAEDNAFLMRHAGVRVRLQTSRKFTVSMLLNARSWMPSDAFHALDAHLQWTASKAVTVSLSGRNLLAENSLRIRLPGIYTETEQSLPTTGRWVLLRVQAYF